MSISNTSCFFNKVYQGNVQVLINQDKNSSAFLIEAEGERVSLQNFQGPYLDDLKKVFGKQVKVFSNEFEDMREIFGNALARKDFADRKPQSDEKVHNRIAFNAKRAFEGNPFTGFAIVEKTANKIIGFISIGRGFERGDSQSALILNPNYTNQGYGREAAILAGCLAYIYAQNNFKVGSKRDPVPVQKFTATSLDSNKNSIDFIRSLGLKRIRKLTPKEAYTEDPASLYAIEAQDVEKQLKEALIWNRFSWSFNNESSHAE